MIRLNSFRTNNFKVFSIKQSKRCNCVKINKFCTCSYSLAKNSHQLIISLHFYMLHHVTLHEVKSMFHWLMHFKNLFIVQPAAHLFLLKMSDNTVTCRAFYKIYERLYIPSIYRNQPYSVGSWYIFNAENNTSIHQNHTKISIVLVALLPLWKYIFFFNNRTVHSTRIKFDPLFPVFTSTFNLKI